MAAGVLAGVVILAVLYGVWHIFFSSGDRHLPVPPPPASGAQVTDAAAFSRRLAAERSATPPTPESWCSAILNRAAHRRAAGPQSTSPSATRKPLRRPTPRRQAAPVPASPAPMRPKPAAGRTRNPRVGAARPRPTPALR